MLNIDHDASSVVDIIEGRRPEHDVYPTPEWLAKAALRADMLSYQHHHSPIVLDVGAGSGVWGTEARKIWGSVLRIEGIELRPLPRPEAYDQWYVDDFLSPMSADGPYDVIIGNPPYGIAEAVIRRSFELLAPEGEIHFLLRLNFLGGQGRALGLFKEFPPYKITVIPKRPSFSGNGKTDSIEYAMYHWSKSCNQQYTQVDWLTIPEEVQSKRFRQLR